MNLLIKTPHTKHYELFISALIFTLILVTHYPFHKAIILMLEFIVVIEVVKMISDFVVKRKLRLRYVIDVFIVFLIRDVVILVTNPKKEFEEILFLLFVILIFFIFRVMTLKFSPSLISKMAKGSYHNQ
ncbi:MAG TPA: phosphate-starvation-inducible PsiE family protein [Sulfurovum sp.]|uniref:phosphate-starvation-inducible PsiE family protein n=1 Tax=Sulfurovum sp. TaxID=1969726 RepID=UPI002F921A1F